MPTHHQLQRIVAAHLFAATMPAYCTTPGCNYATVTTNFEETRGYCPCCERRSVTSALVL